MALNALARIRNHLLCIAPEGRAGAERRGDGRIIGALAGGVRLGRVPLTGMCEVREDGETAAVLATLSATNRWLAQY